MLDNPNKYKNKQIIKTLDKDKFMEQLATTENSGEHIRK